MGIDTERMIRDCRAVPISFSQNIEQLSSFTVVFGTVIKGVSITLSLKQTESFGLGRWREIKKGMKMSGDSWRQRVGLLSSFGNVS